MMRIVAPLACAAAFLFVTGVARADSLTVGGFHGNPARSGNYVVPGLTWAEAATLHPLTGWAGGVQGPVHAQPLYYHPAGAAHGLIIVVSDDDVVQALDAGSGVTVWARTLGPAVPSRNNPCGNPGLWPDVGTPVIDDAAGVVYVIASQLNRKRNIAHLVYGLSLADGSVLPGWPVDIRESLATQGLVFPAATQTVRGALALVGSTLYVPFGGGDGGDCLPYHGWVMGLNVAAPAVSAWWETRGEWGGVWAQGGVTYDGTSLFVVTGNTANTNVWADGEAVLRMAPDLARSSDPRDYFTPTDWLKLDTVDHDLGGSGPLPIDVPLAGGGTAAWLLQLGKDGKAYILDRANLGGTGGALLVQPLANGPIRTSPAVWPASGGLLVTMKASGIACPPPAANIGVTTIEVTANPAPAISTVWCAAMLGQGTPTVTTTDGSSYPVVWIVGSDGDNQLHGLRGDTGQALFAPSAATQIRHTHHYVTPLFAEGHLYIASDTELYAFGFGP